MFTEEQIKKVNQLEVGDTFKNYPELCRYLDISPTGGKIKKRSIAEFERYVGYVKEGNAFIITEIYDEPKAKSDSDELRKSLELIMEHVISRHFEKQQEQNSEQVPIYISKVNLAIECSLINSFNYRLSRCRQEALAKVLEIPVETVNDWFTSEEAKISYRIKSTLERLEKQKWIIANKSYAYKIKGQKIQYADDWITSVILGIEHQVLEEWETTIQEIIYRGEAEDYYGEVATRLQFATDKDGNRPFDEEVEYYYSVWKIIPTPQWENRLKEVDTLDKLTKKLVECVSNKANEGADKRYNKYMESLELVETPIENATEKDKVLIKKAMKKIKKLGTEEEARQILKTYKENSRDITDCIVPNGAKKIDDAKLFYYQGEIEEEQKEEETEEEKIIRLGGF